jgi:serine O-acetyltransferase
MDPAEDDLSVRLRQEALRVQEEEPELATLLHRTVLSPSVRTFDDAVACTICYRLLLHPCGKIPAQQATTAATAPMFCPNSLRGLVSDAIASELLEEGHTMADAIREDALAVCRRDPATDTLLEVVLFAKGFAALVCHRAAHRLWHKDSKHRKKFTALFLQSQASAVFGLDIHPGARIGMGVMLDHGTGIVIGETAVVGDGCTLLHAVTLGGTGKDHGDRHPKIGRNVLIGAGTSILGNITIGDGAKIGAGSVVLRPIPAGATAVGAPAKIIGRAKEVKPGSVIDGMLENVSLLHSSPSMSRMSDTTSSITTSTASEEELKEEENGNNPGASMCPWRDYTQLAKRAPPGSMTICTLRKLLHDCTMEEVGNCFFALDTMNVCHVHMDVLLERGVGVIVQHTHLDKARVQDLVASFFRLEALQIR